MGGKIDITPNEEFLKRMAVSIFKNFKFWIFLS